MREPNQVLILGDAWERSYGDLQWRHLQPDRFLGDGIRLALSGGNAAEGGIEPLDWLVDTTPVDWRIGTGTARYAWSRPWGADPAVD